MKLVQTTTDLFLKPPYRGLPALVWAYALVCCCLAYSVTGPMNGMLIGSDDHARMLQVLNWINGAPWYDRHITRVDAPEGFTTIWSRLVDIPIAATVLAAQMFTDQRHAALVASFIVPFAELGILFMAARYYARPLIGKNEARLIVLFIMFTTVMNYKDFSLAGFHAGEASHHPWYIILILLLYGAIGRAALGLRSHMMIGLSAAFLLAVGIEALPLIGLATITVSITAWYCNNSFFAARMARGLGLGAIGGLILLPLHQPLSHYLTISFAQPSILGPILVGVAALFLFVEMAVLRNDSEGKNFKLTLIALIALVMTALLILVFPAILDGPGAGLSPEERAMAFRSHAEAKTLFHAAHGWFDFLCLSMPLLIGLGAGIIACRRETNQRRRALMLSYLGFAAGTAAMAQAISRFYHHGIIYACGWLLWAWQKLRDRIALKNLAVSTALFVVLCPLWLLFLPALPNPHMTMARILSFPNLRQSIPDPCNILPFADYLNAHYDKNTLLMAPGGESSRLLYYSNLKIDFLNLYPSGNKFIDNEYFYSTQDLRVAAYIALSHKIDLVALCPIPTNAPPLRPGEEPMMFERLQNGGSVPWLRRITVPGSGAYMLFEVDKAALASFLTQP